MGFELTESILLWQHSRVILSHPDDVGEDGVAKNAQICIPRVLVPYFVGLVEPTLLCVRTTSRSRRKKSQVSIFFQAFQVLKKKSCKLQATERAAHRPQATHRLNTRGGRAAARAPKCRSAFLILSTNSQPRWFVSLVFVSSFEFQGSRLEAFYSLHSQTEADSRHPV